VRPLRTVRACAHVGLPHLCLDKHHPASTPLIRLRRCRRPSPERAAITADQSRTTDTGKARFRKARPRAPPEGPCSGFLFHQGRHAFARRSCSSGSSARQLCQDSNCKIRTARFEVQDWKRIEPKRKSRAGGHRTAHFHNCRLETGSVVEFRRGQQRHMIVAGLSSSGSCATQLLSG